MTITAYTAPGEILMITIAEGEIDLSEEVEPCIAVVDLDADERVLGIEVIQQSQFDLAAVAAEYGIADLVPEIEAAIATAKPGP
ncbi:MAG: DUF2283 domain-containing protein [Gaiellales bacterium]